MNFDTAITSILLFSRNSLASANSDIVGNKSSNIQIDVAQRFILSLALLLLLFILGVGFVDLLFINKYPLTFPKENPSVLASKGKSNIREIIEAPSEFDTSAIESDEDIAIRITTEAGGLEDEDYDSEELDTLAFLDQHSFYNNLNNSSQYLRRDSFSQ